MHMHPGMMAWWKWKHHNHHHAEHAHAGHAGHHGEGACGADWADARREHGHHGHEGHEAHFGHEGWDGDGGGGFGVRRPLRFLAHKLELDDKQVEELASILNDLKTERAQGAVDHRRTVAGFADLIAGEAFDGDKAGSVASDRVKSAERLRDALVKALGRIHALLRPEQRARFAYLIRTGALTL